MSLQDFLAMSGYGAYVWPCYGLTFAVLLWNLWSARRRLQDEIVQARRRVQAQQEARS